MKIGYKLYGLSFHIFVGTRFFRFSSILFFYIYTDFYFLSLNPSSGNNLCVFLSE